MRLLAWLRQCCLLAVFTFSLLGCRANSASPAFLTGVDANYSLQMAEAHAIWHDGQRHWPTGSALSYRYAFADLLSLLKQSGANAFRVRVWTGDTGPCGLADATSLARSAQHAGMKPYLIFFLNENWSDYVKQPAPAAWRDLSFADKLAKVAQYSEATARAFRAAGVETDLYEIGNEIDFGICGEFEEEWGKRLSIPYMKQRIWPREADIIHAAQAGILKVNPSARFILHLTRWWDADFCLAFLKAMGERQVQVDYLGLSFFPTSGLSERNDLAELDRSVRQINQQTHKRVIICEYAYPSLPSFGGQFATWNKAAGGYPLDETGQARWIADFLAFARTHPAIAGAFYWSPEWYSEEMWKAFALFRPDGSAKPGLTALKR